MNSNERSAIKHTNRNKKKNFEISVQNLIHFNKIVLIMRNLIEM